MATYVRSGGVNVPVKLRAGGSGGVLSPAAFGTPGAPVSLDGANTLAAAGFLGRRSGASLTGTGAVTATSSAAPTGVTTYAAEPLGAGGWVTGMSISPDGLTRLVRCDTYGAWRWDAAADAWVAAISGSTMPFPENQLDTGGGVGVQAIVAGNSVAYMGYKTGVYKSTDRGATWTKVLSGPATLPNTGNQRWWNPRMVLDPDDNTICLYGTTNDGFYYTTNAGAAWTQVPAASLPWGTAGIGVVATAVDPAGNWYAAPWGSGLYKSGNLGATWTKISSDAQFVAVTGMAAGPNGDIIITGHTDATTLTSGTSVVYRYRSSAWTALAPTGARAWRSVAYDPVTPGNVHIQGEGGYERRSTDYGTTWSAPFHSFTSPADDVPWLAASNGFGADFFFVTVGGLQFDPIVSGRLWMSQGIGVWYADLPAILTDRVPWVSQSRGIEQLVVNDVLCPPGGPPVVTCWDRAIFLAGESQAAPNITVATPPSTPITVPASLAGVQTRGYPAPFTYAWTVPTKPAGSTATFSDSTALQTTFTPDVVGSYVLRLTASNSAGSTITNVNLTAVAKVTALILPGTTGNYLSTPATASLDLTGSFTMKVKLSMADWAPATKQPIMGKWDGGSKSYALTIDSTGFLGNVATASNGSAGAFNVSSGAFSWPAGGMLWVEWTFDATAKTMRYRISQDNSTWTTISTQSTPIVTTAIAVSTANLTAGFNSALAGAPYMNGRIYQAQLYDASSTLVAGFNAEGITRTGTRTPSTYTDSTGKVWTPQGTGWDWS